jgi:protein-S-isoprenylcysteine O-methyltransferase Ste14
MGGVAGVQAPRGHPEVLRGIVARAVQIGFVLVVEGALVFGGAGRLDWVWAWAYIAIYLASIAVNATLLLRASPEMIAERGRPAEFKRWDAVISGAWSLFQFAAIPLVAGLDARFAWSGAVGIGWHLAGGLAFAAGLALFGWAMVENAYFSTAARIQGDRGQTVCRTGPYRFVRHPGYSGTILQAAGMAVLLGSWWALLPALAASALITLRTVLEDRMLQAELPGYPDYSRMVRFRLVPGIW